MTDIKGLYIHVPFCKSKCPYCDFYSFIPGDDLIDRYTSETVRRLKNLDGCYDTVYFGGGTPDLLGAARTAALLECINLSPGAEITLECNPSDAGTENSIVDFAALKKSGVNRISMGLQSADDGERKMLGRRSGITEAERAIDRVFKAGIDNISLDVMMGIPGQTGESLIKTLDFCAGSGASHISAYILKIEDGTYFSKVKDKLNLPDDDAVGDMYLTAVDYLNEKGFKQYEISNFAKLGFESRHNLKYWLCEEYEGIGPAAHSFINGKRYYFERDIDSYLRGAEPVYDCDGGDIEEYIMLRLRLSSGLELSELRQKYNYCASEQIKSYADFLNSKGLAVVTENRIALTPRGFLVSNSIIADIINKL